MPSKPSGAVTVAMRNKSQSSPTVEMTESSSHFCSRKRFDPRARIMNSPCALRSAYFNQQRLPGWMTKKASEDRLQSRHEHLAQKRCSLDRRVGLHLRKGSCEAGLYIAGEGLRDAG